MRCAMPPTTTERYAVVSCHVERPLDDAVWAAFAELQQRRPGGFSIAALIRPPDPAAGEHDEGLWVGRAREASDRGPVGHHTHFTGPTHARPTGGDTGDRVRREGEWLRERGVVPTLFCGGGWYTDRSVALACAELGYTDCTPRAKRPGYLPEGAAWAMLAAPARVELDESVALPVVPTTHAVGDLVRALAGWRLPAGVHAYFHDTDLLSRRRRALIVAGLGLLGDRRPPTDLDTLATSVRNHAPRLTWVDIAQGETAAGGT
jgi:hypothetical protein